MVRVLVPLVLLLVHGFFAAATSRGSAQEWTIVDVAAKSGEEADFPPIMELPFFSRRTLSSASRRSGVGAQNRIAFGNKARKGQFPYVASLLKSSSSGAGFYHSCTATLIAPNLLLTAAHCFFNTTNGAWNPPNQVLLGGIDLSYSSNFRETITPTNFLYPSTYSITSFDTAGGDIGIVVLATPSKVFPVVKLAMAVPPPGTILTAVGFGIDEKLPPGSTPPNQPPKINRSLKYTTVRTSPDACTSPPKGTICAVGVKQFNGISGTCAGDSGGPELLSNGLQVSVTSYGPDVDCGSGAWGVYTSIPDYYSSFIKPTMDKYAPDGVDNSTPSVNGNSDDNSSGGGGGSGGGGNGGGNSGNNGNSNGSGNNGNGNGYGNGNGGGNNNANANSNANANANTSSANIEEESDPSVSSGTGTGGGCAQWTWNGTGNQRIVDGTPINSGLGMKVANVAACGNKCGAVFDCNSFNYQRGTRKCLMFEEGAGMVSTVKDPKFVSGILTCGDRRK